MRRLAIVPAPARAPASRHPGAHGPAGQAASVRRGDVAAADWLDWRWQLRHMITSADEMAGVIDLADEERAGLAAAGGLFRFGLTPYYADLMDREHASCPIRMQSIPRVDEADVTAEELTDPLGEDTHRPTAALVHKYPDRCLLLVLDRCAIYCRHCNRRRLVGGDDPITRADIDEAIAYVARTRRIRDVLLSGGDPLLLPSDRLDGILARLRAIPHVEIIRIGTRLPVVMPMRIDAELCAVLRRHHPLFVNTHFNHPRELTAEARAACERLVDAGIPVGNQTVLLRGVNSSVRCLRRLMRGLLTMRVRPYYLFQGDTVVGTDHMRTPVEAAIELVDGMRGWMTGMGMPHLVIDAPGGGGKIPIGPTYVRALDEQSVLLRDYRGREVSYPQPRRRDCAVAYDDVYFAGEPPDDDREGGVE